MSTNTVIKIIAIAAIALAGLKIIKDNTGGGSVEAMPITQSTAQAPVIQQPTSVPVSTPAEKLQPMTGEQCAAAGASKGMSATWGSASNGCWLISPDGATVIHVGTWKE